MRAESDTSIPHPYHRRTRYDREQSVATGGRIACYGWVSAGFPWSADTPEMGGARPHNPKVAGSNPAPATKALVNHMLARASRSHAVLLPPLPGRLTGCPLLGLCGSDSWFEHHGPDGEDEQNVYRACTACDSPQQSADFGRVGLLIDEGSDPCCPLLEVEAVGYPGDENRGHSYEHETSGEGPWFDCHYESYPGQDGEDGGNGDPRARGRERVHEAIDMTVSLGSQGEDLEEDVAADVDDRTADVEEEEPSG